MKLTYGERRAQRWRRVLLKAWGATCEADLPPQVRERLAAEMESWRARLSPEEEARRALRDGSLEIWRAEQERFAQMIREAN